MSSNIIYVKKQRNGIIQSGTIIRRTDTTQRDDRLTRCKLTVSHIFGTRNAIVAGSKISALSISAPLIAVTVPQYPANYQYDGWQLREPPLNHSLPRLHPGRWPYQALACTKRQQTQTTLQNTAACIHY
jgi:hypothetical protein